MPPSNTKVSNEWNYISIPPSTFMACTGTTVSLIRLIFTIKNTAPLRVYVMSDHFKQWESLLVSLVLHTQRKRVTLCNCWFTGPARHIHTNPGRSWGPLSLLSNGYRVSFPEVKQPKRGLTTQSHLSHRFRMAELQFYSPSVPRWRITGRHFALRYSPY
jgi:hypothetical protein